DRLDQADRPDLHEVLELLPAVGVPPRQRADERHVLLDQFLACREIAVLVIAAEENLVVLLLVHCEVSSRSTRFWSSIQTPSERSSAPKLSTTVSSTRRRPTPFSRCSSSARSRSARNGPIAAVTESSPTSRSTVRSPSSPRRSISAARAVPRSSMTL